MKLPNADRARVDRAKIVDYLLNSAHPDGAGKAAFFGQLGFVSEEWEVLAASLRRHGQSNELTKTVESAHGTRYTVDGELETPDGREPKVRTVWIQEKAKGNPRLITAYPIGK